MPRPRRTKASLEEELRKLEKSSPYVAAAARSLAAVSDRIASGRMDAIHPLPCTDTRCWWHHLQPGEKESSDVSGETA